MIVARWPKCLAIGALLLSAATAWADPAAITVASAPVGGAAGVFRSVALAVSSFPAARNWNSVRSSVESADFSHCAAKVDCSARQALEHAIKDIVASDLHRKLDVVNRAVNRLVRYVPDEQNYGAMDVWATPDMTLARRKGDCEDYAILKMAALKEAGVPLKDMSVVVVRDIQRNQYHAVLAIKTADGYLVLDSLSDKVASDRDILAYTPLYSIGVAGAWLHGFATGEGRGSS